MNHEQLKRKALSNPDVKTEYDALEPEVALLKEMLSARCGKTVLKTVGKRYSRSGDIALC